MVIVVHRAQICLHFQYLLSTVRQIVWYGLLKLWEIAEIPSTGTEHKRTCLVKSRGTFPYQSDFRQWMCPVLSSLRIWVVAGGKWPPGDSLRRPALGVSSPVSLLFVTRWYFLLRQTYTPDILLVLL